MKCDKIKIGDFYREKTPGTANIIKITKISESEFRIEYDLFMIEYDLFMDDFVLAGEINGENAFLDFNNIYEYSEKLTEEFIIRDIIE